ncbi:hypothetical protein Sru01_39460 [Sphaerisporangium rufum]|uniref:Uncharacterized protein n=1 Tax=Sphaerisporangium rufum TaxID=1381558 RepID=A0A919R3M8_9ACTN|nr:hypothetical protein [Sphaerisporangium rufum]GII78964.1 hypothetical protein Sru01_39460 [Sphaerisporangium rufum]
MGIVSILKVPPAGEQWTGRADEGRAVAGPAGRMIRRIREGGPAGWEARQARVAPAAVQTA